MLFYIIYKKATNDRFAPLPDIEMVRVQILARTILCGVCMSFLRMRGFSPGTLLPQSKNTQRRVIDDSKWSLRCDSECVWLFVSVLFCSGCSVCNSTSPFSSEVGSSILVTRNGNKTGLKKIDRWKIKKNNEMTELKKIITVTKNNWLCTTCLQKTK